MKIDGGLWNQFDCVENRMEDLKLQDFVKMSWTTWDSMSQMCQNIVNTNCLFSFKKMPATFVDNSSSYVWRIFVFYIDEKISTCHTSMIGIKTSNQYE